MSLELRRAIPEAHEKPVLCIAYNPLNRELFTGSEDGRIMVWERETGRLLRTLNEHKGWVTGLYYHIDNKLLFSCSVDGRLLAWNFAGIIVQVEDIKFPFYCMAWEPRRQQLILGCDNEIRTFSLIKDNFDPNRKDVIKKQYVVNAHSDVVRAILCIEGKIYSASYDRSMCIYDAENPRKFILVPNRHASGITALDFDPDNNWIVSGSFDRTIRVWSLDCKLLHKFDHFEDIITGLCYVPATKSLWASTNSASLVSLDLRTTTDITEFIIDKSMEKRGEEEEIHVINKLFWLNESQEMLGWMTSKQLMFWKYTPSVSVSVCRGHTDGIEALYFSNRDSSIQLFSAGGDGYIHKWEPMQLNSQLYTPDRILFHPGIALCIAFHDELDLLVVALDDNSIRIIPYELVSQRLTELVRSGANDHADKVSGLKIVGDTLLSVSWDASIRYWSLKKGNLGDLISSIRNAHDDIITSIDYSPKTKEFATCGADKIIKIWDFETSKLRCTFFGHTGEVSLIMWNPIYECWVSASDDRTVRFWDTQGNQLYDPYDTKEETVTAITYDKVLGYVIMALRDKSMRVYEPKRSEVVQTYHGHTDEIRGIIHIPDLQQYVTASWDHSLRVWHAVKDKGLSRTRKAVSAPGSMQTQDNEEGYRPYELDHPLTQPKTLARIGINRPQIEKTIAQERKIKVKKKKPVEEKKAPVVSSSLLNKLNELEASIYQRDSNTQQTTFGQTKLSGNPTPGSRGGTSKGVSRSASVVSPNTLPSLSAPPNTNKPPPARPPTNQRTLPQLPKVPLTSQSMS